MCHQHYFTNCAQSVAKNRFAKHKIAQTETTHSGLARQSSVPVNVDPKEDVGPPKHDDPRAKKPVEHKPDRPERGSHFRSKQRGKRLQPNEDDNSGANPTVHCVHSFEASVSYDDGDSR